MFKSIKNVVMLVLALFIIVLMLPIIGLTYLFSILHGRKYSIIIEPTNYSFLDGIINIDIGHDRIKPNKVNNDEDDIND
jgi:hypothetical protein